MTELRETLQERYKMVSKFADEAQRRAEHTWGGSTEEYWKGTRDALAKVLWMIDQEDGEI